MKWFPESELFDTSKASFWQRFAIHNFESRGGSWVLWAVLFVLFAYIGYISEILFFQGLSLVALLHVILGLEAKVVVKLVKEKKIRTSD